MTRAISVLLGLGLLAATGAAADFPRTFQEHAAVQESLARVHPRMRASWLRERGIEDPYYTSVRMPDSGQRLREVGRWSYGPSYDVDGRVTASETLVALARGSGVSLLRFSRQDSLSIELLSDINAEGLMCRVKVVDTLLYVGSRGGLEVYNIADEQNPVRLSWTPIPLNDFALQDSLAYTISGDDSFRIYNVSNPASPVCRGACRDSGDLVSVAGNAAFVGDRRGLYVIDVSNPVAPRRIGAWGSAIEQVLARGNLCYVTTFNPNQTGDITFRILDVTVPANPVQIGSLDSTGGHDVHLLDTLAFCSGDADVNWFKIVSLSDSTRPHVIGAVGTPGWSYGIWASGLAQSAFVGCHWKGLQVYDTRNTSQPVRDTGLLGADMAVDVEVDDGKAYVAGYKSGLHILDVSVPSLPTCLGCYDSGGTVRSATARDSFAYVSWPWPRMLTLDVTNPHRPLRAAGCDGMFAYPEDMVIRDSFVYCAEMNRFQIVNVARPREPVLAGSCVIGDYTWDMDMENDLAASTHVLSLQLEDVSRPDSPRVVGSWSGGASGVDIVDTIAYVVAPYTGLVALNVARPAQVQTIDSLYLTDTIWWNDVVVVGSLAYVGGERIWVVDVTDPRNLRLVPGVSWTPPNLVRRLQYARPYLYAACYEAGVCVLDTVSVAVAEQPITRARTPMLTVTPSVVAVHAVAHIDGVVGWVRITLYDAAGRATFVLRVKADSVKKTVDLPVANLPPGVYVVRAEWSGGSCSQKVVKQARRR